jgi:hypothetical protein
VCEERDLLTMQEDLAADLQDDLEKATQTFELVEQATKQQNLQTEKDQNKKIRSSSGAAKAISAASLDRAVDPRQARDGVLGEVKALQPNHESRLEAIERAEKARQRDLSTREDAFKQELGAFVEEGKLKKSGGVEEVERVRLIREERARKENAEREAARLKAKAEKREREREAAAAAAAAAAAEPQENATEPAAEETASADAPADAPAEEDKESQAPPPEGANPA